MHLYANSMNILERLQQRLPVERTEAEQRAAAERRNLVRSAFELHRLGGNGSMAGQTGQWDGDARRQPGRKTKRDPLPVRTEEDEVVLDESVSFWA